MTTPATQLGTVSELWRYPVKSMLGEQVSSVTLTNLGIDGDRRFALRDLGSGKIISAKQPKFGRVLLQLHAHRDPASDTVHIRIGDDTFDVSQTDELNSRLSVLLGCPVALVAATTNDETYESYWPEIEGLALSDVTTDFPIGMFTDKGTFADLGALHLITTASVAALQSYLPDTVVDHRRFRPSMVIDTTSAPQPAEPTFVENAWVQQVLTVGTAEITVGLAAPRCIMTTLAQPGLPEAKEVLQTLAKENRIAFPGFGDFACLGVYAEVTKPGTVTVGDTVSLASAS
jgi:uncharacterized protein